MTKIIYIELLNISLSYKFVECVGTKISILQLHRSTRILPFCLKNNFVGVLHIRQIYEKRIYKNKITVIKIIVVKACHHNNMSIKYQTVI